MSWIQNFFQRFKKDNEDEFIDNDLHNDKHVSSQTNQHLLGGKELDTKISYQYPKGKIDYTLKSKFEHEKSRKSPRKRRMEQQPENKDHGPTEEQHVIKEAVKIKPPQTARRTRPFHPTEIPSPIFGFNKPTIKDTAVEHELSEFIFDKVDEKIEKSTSMDQDVHQEESPVFEQKEVQAEPFLEDQEEVQEETPFVDLDIDKKQALVESETENNNNLLYFEEKVEKQPEPSTQKRSGLPFNVMMLKQDKLNWQESKRRSLEEKKRSQQTERHVVEKIDKEPLKSEMLFTESHLDTNFYEFPQLSLLTPPVEEVKDTAWLSYQEELLNETLHNFNVGAKVVNVTQGPSVTRFEVQPEPGVKVNKITNLSDDIKLSLAAKDIRIEAPIPGKHTIGIEVPNQKSRPVLINEIIQSSVFLESESPLTAVLGLDISGKPIVTDLKKMPHGLIAGATGSGKSVCINTILVSLLFKASPEDLKLLLIDPKMVELAPYNRIPHLVSPVITDVKAATAALKWAVDEMERRYELFAHTGVRDINRFNELAMQHKRYSDKLPFIVIIIDELADLMMMSPADVEEAICRIAQKARACGIHLIVATQRPSVDVITGLIKANIPTRIAFSVSSQIDSRTIIDVSGAEKLLGRGDMLFLENGSSKPVRLQGTFVSDEEIDLVVAHVREEREPEYLFEQEELLKKAQVTEEEDELFFEACEFIIDQGSASTSSLQRRFKIGYNRAARLMDLLEDHGFITSANGSKPREVLVTELDLESISGSGAMNESQYSLNHINK